MKGCASVQSQEPRNKGQEPRFKKKSNKNESTGAFFLALESWFLILLVLKEEIKPYGTFIVIPLQIDKNDNVMKTIRICWDYYFANADKLFRKVCEAEVF